ncbi:glycoside hydrolase family 1 protein [Candidatus Kaiserbacteria bacterium]|nr:glycoside hydrolase family 1 protein [Candidatus Kaiserbacteria bacterium]MCB9812006.1 glycoside hydrolase family 1 protein [Candidatus Nomurabacteria bacterium]
MKKFPENFYWGAATASYQVEGGIENTDWAKAATEGRVPPCGRACDHYHRYESDFDLAKELGHNAHRFSLEWARIEPREGEFDMEAVEHYRNVIAALKARGMRPFITLWHFTLPLWFSESGGFERKDSPQVFARYAAFVAKELGTDLVGISTMNEPNVIGSNGWLRGSWPPFKRFSLTDMVSITNSGRTYEAKAQKGIKNLWLYLRVMKNLARAHNAAYDAIKAEAPAVEVSVVKHVIFFHANWNPINKVIAWFANYFWTSKFMRRTYKKCDSVGLNYYFHKKFGDKAVYEKTDMDWDIYPEGIYGSLKLLSKYKRPLFVSEAGLADEADKYRADYITRQVRAVWQAIEDGMDVRGHMYWSLLDNYEWALGFEKRFGLIEIDYETLERKVRPSAYVYKQICENNGLFPQN